MIRFTDQKTLGNFLIFYRTSLKTVKVLRKTKSLFFYLFIAIQPICILTKIEAHMYKLLNSLLENKNFQMKESASCIDFETLCTMKPKKIVELRKPAAKPVLIKGNREKPDEEVIKYIQRNHTVSDLALNQKQIDKRSSLPIIVIAKKNVTVTYNNPVNQHQVNAINPKHRYAVSDLGLAEKKIDERLSLPLIFAGTKNEAPLYSCICIDDLSTCEPTMLFKITGKDSSNCKNLELSINEKMVKHSKESLDDKEINICQEDIISDLNLLHVKPHAATDQKSVKLQLSVPIVIEDEEKELLNLDFNENKELKDDNKKKVKEGRFRKVFKRVRNIFKKYF